MVFYYIDRRLTPPVFRGLDHRRVIPPTVAISFGNDPVSRSNRLHISRVTGIAAESVTGWCNMVDQQPSFSSVFQLKFQQPSVHVNNTIIQAAGPAPPQPFLQLQDLVNGNADQQEISRGALIDLFNVKTHVSVGVMTLSSNLNNLAFFQQNAVGHDEQ